MQKKFISNLILILILNLLIKTISIFGIDATVQNKVFTNEYGIYYTLLNLSFLFNILLDLGINNFTTKNLAKFPHIVQRYFGKLLFFRFFLFFVYTLITLIIAIILGYEKYELYLLSLLVLNQFLANLIIYFRSHFTGLLMFKAESIFSVLDRFLLIILCGSIFIIHPAYFKIEWFIWTQTICYFLATIIGYFTLINKIGKPKFSFNWTFSLAIIKKSFPYALLVILMTFYTRLDAVLIERFHLNGQVESGYYAQGFRIIDALYMFGMIFTSLLFPMFSKQIHLKENILPLLKLSANLLIGGAIILAIISYFYSYELLKLVYYKDLANTILLFKILMFSFISLCFSLIFGTLLTANGSLKFLNTISAIAIFINLGFNSVLIPKYGALGASITFLITQSFICVLQFSFTFLHFKIRVKFINILQYLGFIFINILIWKFMKLSDSFYINLFLNSSLSVISLITFKLIELKNLLILLKKKDSIKLEQ